ncbi:MAG: hypothetical protein PHZ09_09095 [Eubacteriales bacterium]|nr:hypothetical protein [Eubacteriales bacterium]
MKKERWFFYILFAICILGFVFGVYYGEEISIYYKNPIVEYEVEYEIKFELIAAFLHFYYEAAKVQILIFISSFTVFSAPVGIFAILYAAITLGASAYVISELQVSSVILNLSVLYTFMGVISLYLYVEMAYRGYGYSKIALRKIAQSQKTRSYLSGMLLLSSLILAAEICRYFVIIKLNNIK